MSNKGTLYVIAAPSGGGKTSLVQALIKQVSNLFISVSYTTRPPRPSDQQGVDYFFVDNQEFDEIKRAGRFLESAVVFGNQYGTSKDWVLDELNKGRDVILEIDWQGARSVSDLYPNSVSIFIVPPSLEVLRQRLQLRASDDLDVINHRMDKAQAECEHYHEFDYLVINDDFTTALDDLSAIVRSKRLEMACQNKKLSCLLEDLLKKQ